MENWSGMGVLGTAYIGRGKTLLGGIVVLRCGMGVLRGDVPGHVVFEFGCVDSSVVLRAGWFDCHECRLTLVNGVSVFWA